MKLGIFPWTLLVVRNKKYQFEPVTSLIERNILQRVWTCLQTRRKSYRIRSTLETFRSRNWDLKPAGIFYSVSYLFLLGYRHHWVKPPHVVGDMVASRAAMYCMQCTILLHLRVTNHILEIQDLYVYCGKFPADGTQVSFLTKVTKMIWGRGTFLYLHKGALVGSGDLVFLRSCFSWL